jgi:hypothetical protein
MTESSSLEALAIELAEASLGRGIYVRRTIDESHQTATLRGKFKTACNDETDKRRVARVRQLYRDRILALEALWNCASARAIDEEPRG